MSCGHEGQQQQPAEFPGFRSTGVIPKGPKGNLDLTLKRVEIGSD